MPVFSTVISLPAGTLTGRVGPRRLSSPRSHSLSHFGDADAPVSGATENSAGEQRVSSPQPIGCFDHERTVAVPEVEKQNVVVEPRVLDPAGVSIEDLYNRARAETSYVASVASQMRDDPDIFRDMVEFSARSRHEFLPDLFGNAPDIKEGLKDPALLTKQIRYTIHNTLLELGQWSLVSHFLERVVEIDNSPLNGSQQEERALLVVLAMEMIEQAMGIVGRRLARAIRAHKRFEGVWARIHTYEERWTGAQIAILDNDLSDALEVSPTLDGSLYRFAKVDWELDTTRELVDIFSQTPLEDLEDLGEHFVDCVNELKGFYDLFALLIYHIKDVPLQDRDWFEIKQLRDNSEAAQKILDSAALGHIKSIDSISEPTAFESIWSEIDRKTSQACGAETLEELIGYRRILPRWTVATRSARAVTVTPAPPTPPPPEPEPLDFHLFAIGYAEHVSDEASEDEDAPTVAPEPAPVKLKPVSDVSDWKPAPVEEVKVRNGPKIKTRGVASPPKISAHAATDAAPAAAQPLEEKPIFRVKRRVYEVFAQIFGHEGGHVKQVAFIKAMESLGFKKIEDAGCRFTLKPIPGYLPVIMKYKAHKLHNGKSELSLGMRSTVRKRLEEEYGWTLDCFCITRSA